MAGGASLRLYRVGVWVAFPFLKYALRREPADDELFHRVLDEHQDAEGRPRLRDWIERVAAHPRRLRRLTIPNCPGSVPACGSGNGQFGLGGGRR